MSKKLSFNPEAYSPSRYSTVIGVAKRAREITEDAAENKEILEVKPVRLAMEELMEGQYHIVPAPVNPDDDAPLPTGSSVTDAPDKTPEEDDYSDLILKSE